MRGTVQYELRSPRKKKECFGHIPTKGQIAISCAMGTDRVLYNDNSEESKEGKGSLFLAALFFFFFEEIEEKRREGGCKARP